MTRVLAHLPSEDPGENSSLQGAVRGCQIVIIYILGVCLSFPKGDSMPELSVAVFENGFVFFGRSIVFNNLMAPFGKNAPQRRMRAQRRYAVFLSPHPHGCTRVEGSRPGSRRRRVGGAVESGCRKSGRPRDRGRAAPRFRPFELHSGHFGQPRNDLAIDSVSRVERLSRFRRVGNVRVAGIAEPPGIGGQRLGCPD